MTHEQCEPIGRRRAALSAPFTTALIACGCVLLTACGSGGAAPNAEAGGETNDAAGSAPFRGKVAGLETQTWVVNDTTGEVGRALAG